MKKIDQIMAELGFNKDAPNSTKEAFIKHLLAHSGIRVMTPSEKKEVQAHPEKIKPLLKPDQLTFSFIEDEPLQHKPKKSVS